MPSQVSKGVTAEPATSITLRRILAVGALSPSHAAVLARDLADELERCGADGDLPRVDDTTAQVTGSGHLSLDTSAPPDDDDDTSDVALRRAARLARRLGQVGGRSSRSGGFGRDRRLPDLIADIRAWSARMVDEDDSELTRRLRSEIGAVAAAGGRQHAELIPRRDANADDRTVPGSHSADQHAWHRRRRRPPWKLLFAVATICCVLLATWWLAPNVVDDLRGRWNDVFTAEAPPRHFEPLTPTSHALAVAATDGLGARDPATPAPPDAPAPPAAGPIGAVSLTTLAGECNAGEQCLVQVDIALEPAASSREVSWSFEVIDRCDDTRTKQAGHAFAAQPGWTEVWGTSEVALPEGGALAVVAVTEQPAAAASKPLLIPEDGPC